MQAVKANYGIKGGLGEDEDGASRNGGGVWGGGGIAVVGGGTPWRAIQVVGIHPISKMLAQVALQIAKELKSERAVQGPGAAGGLKGGPLHAGVVLALEGYAEEGGAMPQVAKQIEIAARKNINRTSLSLTISGDFFFFTFFIF